MKPDWNRLEFAQLLGVKPNQLILKCTNGELFEVNVCVGYNIQSKEEFPFEPMECRSKEPQCPDIFRLLHLENTNQERVMAETYYS